MVNRKKIKFFTKTSSFSNLSLSVLFIFTFLLIVFNKTDYFLINKIKSIGTEFTSPFSQIISTPFRVTANITKTLNDYRNLKLENSKLQEEVQRLKKWQTLALKNQLENQAYKKLLNSTDNSINIIKTAAVTSQSSGIYANTLVINAGSIHGIVEDLAVVNEKGLVGKIISTNKNNSKVILINDQNSSIPVKTISNKFYAIIKGSTDGKYLTSSFIKDDKKPKVGDLLLTSGNTNTYPKNILVGKVIKVNQDNFFAIPFVDLKNLSFVQVIDIK